MPDNVLTLSVADPIEVEERTGTAEDGEPIMTGTGEMVPGYKIVGEGAFWQGDKLTEAPHVWGGYQKVDRALTDIRDLRRRVQAEANRDGEPHTCRIVLGDGVEL